MHQENRYLFILLLLLITMPLSVLAQGQTQTETTEPDETAAPQRVDVAPVADDSQISDRLTRILTATEWFQNPQVKVNDGVVFLSGSTETGDHKRWAGDLARNTQDVTAVVNRIEILDPDIWDYQPAYTGLQELWRNIMSAIPFLIFGIVVLVIFWGISVLVGKGARAYLANRQMNDLLQDIAARGIAIVVFLMGIYIVFHVADLTNVALTILGGTGLLGIVLGIAFRDITENFLASIFLSVQNPFHAGDHVEINGNTGFVQRLTIRATLLMTLDGNHLQIPNSTVYKSSILNYTSNPNQRFTFTIGIGYDASVISAQDLATKIFKEHPAVLREPEPLILVDKLASSTINLMFYVWVDGSKHNILKVKSSVLRQIKTAYMAEGISMPDDARERVFLDGVTLQPLKKTAPSDKKKPESTPLAEDSKLITKAEGQLESNDEEILEQARISRSPEEGDDLLKPNK
ncbi:mechanosensitive ion channel domain-containing protein [Fodinibius sediminis]|uniref:Small-conductance mechanosensitive channel n=1 Tax=Fodinibius sediminis TaxID=1214077 RepID=A0A521FFD7_9BACT|nr:mechanosensitive ion channel domain-containing protein [Fodinibius sediminis]SMO94815.1 Small-conductance mechanosensitive channel [Fodinibius sediminis]